MIITKEQQIAVVLKYVKENNIENNTKGHSLVNAFTDGINATIKLMQQIEKRRNEEAKNV